jgi:hypothetical protein
MPSQRRCRSRAAGRQAGGRAGGLTGSAVRLLVTAGIGVWGWQEDTRRVRGGLRRAEALSEFASLAARSIARLHNRDWCGGRLSSKHVGRFSKHTPLIKNVSKAASCDSAQRCEARRGAPAAAPAPARPARHSLLNPLAAVGRPQPPWYCPAACSSWSQASVQSEAGPDERARRRHRRRFRLGAQAGQREVEHSKPAMQQMRCSPANAANKLRRGRRKSPLAWIHEPFFFLGGSHCESQRLSPCACL